MASEKRTRNRNFTDFEKSFLIELTQDHSIVLLKQKDTLTNSLKEKAWNCIIESYNSSEKVSKRDLDSLKVCLINLQSKAKKEDATVRSHRKETGGGPALSMAVSATSSSLISMMPQVFNPLHVLDQGSATCGPRAARGSSNKR